MKPKDLRQINKEEFKQAYHYLKKQTNNFTKINKEFLQKNPQYLLIARLVIGMSQLEFSKQLGTTNKQWIRHFEAGRQGFKCSKLIPKGISVINKYFSQQKILTFKEALKLWKRSQAAREQFFFKPESSNYKIKKISKTSINDFKLYFNYLKKETNNFSNFDPYILVNTPQFITIFRIILNLSHRTLALALNKDPRCVRTHEYREYKLMPNTAKYHIKLFKKLFKEKNLIGKVNFKDCLKNFKRISHYNELEIKIEYILNLIQNKFISIQKHKNIITNKKTLNADFLISLNKKPIIVIEATKLNKTQRKNITHRFVYMDHRFQMIKLKYPSINSIIIAEVDKTQEKLTKRIINKELINTDFCLINNEIKSLKSIIKKFS